MPIAFQIHRTLRLGVQQARVRSRCLLASGKHAAQTVRAGSSRIIGQGQATGGGVAKELVAEAIEDAEG
ncbi:hypothetical protein N9Q04_03430 [Burkholderiales bacterium]|nr:hypothetical protein [Burkholderiales bacterium]